MALHIGGIGRVLVRQLARTMAAASSSPLLLAAEAAAVVPAVTKSSPLPAWASALVERFFR
jgi:hypothetical protein